MEHALWIFPLMIVLIFLGIPIGFALFILAEVILLSWDIPSIVLSHTMYATLDSYTLSALPMFVLMAHILFKAGAGEDLFEFANVFLRRVPGGLAIATIIACAIFAAISGSSAATALTIGIFAIPAMMKRNYHKHFILGVVGGGGVLGILIPPSGLMIIYGEITETSIGKLFIAGIIPGILLAILLIITVVLLDKFKYHTTALSTEKATWEEKKAVLKKAGPALMMPIVVLGGIYSGIFTAIESASVGTVYGAIVCIHRLKAKDWLEILEETAIYTAVLFWVIKPAVVFSQGLSMAYIPQQMTEWVVAQGMSAVTFIAIMTAFYLFMGCFVDGVAMLMLTVPVILNILETLKIDLIWYNIIFILNAEMGCVTPPFGVNIFVLMSLIKGTDIGEVFRGVWPFLVAMLICLILVIIFPALATWLPSKMG